MKYLGIRCPKKDLVILKFMNSPVMKDRRMKQAVQISSKSLMQISLQLNFSLQILSIDGDKNYLRFPKSFGI